MSAVRIIYKSGAQIDINCDSFTTTSNVLGVLTRLEWENARPKPQFLGIDEVAAIWELDA